MVFTCQLAAVLVDVEPDDEVAGVDTPGSGWVVEVDDTDDEVGGRVVDPPVVLVTRAAIGVNGPGLTCSPAAATICHARRVVTAVTATQIATRLKRLTRGVSQHLPG